MDFKKMALDIEDQIIKWRRDLHQIPETGLELPETSNYIEQELDKMGIEYKSGVAGSGIVAIIWAGDEDSKTFAVRADMDALNITEETGLDFASTHEGKMHACGHDSHAAMALGVAKIASENKDKLAGNVKIIFQPAEEGPGGAKPMIEEGALEDPKVDAIVGLHIGTIFKEVKPGQIGVSKGATMACLDSFDIEVEGKGGHGAMPHTTVDPVAVSSSIVQELQTLISREITPVRPGVISVCKIHGGSAYNVIPGKVNMEGTARFIHEEQRQQISKRMEELVEKVADARRAKVKFNYHYGYPPVANPEEFTDYFKGVAETVMDNENIIELKEPVMGGEDMAYFLKEVPGTFFFLGGAKEIDGEIYSHHNSKFDIEESVFHLGTALMAKTAFDWLEKNK